MYIKKQLSARQIFIWSLLLVFMAAISVAEVKSDSEDAVVSEVAVEQEAVVVEQVEAPVVETKDFNKKV